MSGTGEHQRRHQSKEGACRNGQGSRPHHDGSTDGDIRETRQLRGLKPLERVDGESGHQKAGCTTELDYTEQTSWLLFLKYLDGLEQDRAAEAALEGKRYNFILDREYRWESWAAPKDKGGKLDHNVALSGPDLIDFVNGKLFPYLHGFRTRHADSPGALTQSHTVYLRDRGQTLQVCRVRF